jgi:formamidopyrimidine-DNA glycosylase
VPELPEAERARETLESTLGLRIVAVDDRDTYVSRPHQPGEIAGAWSATGSPPPTGEASSSGSRPKTDRSSACISGWRDGSCSRTPVSTHGGTDSRWSSRTGRGSPCATGDAWAAPCSTRTTPMSGLTRHSPRAVPPGDRTRPGTGQCAPARPGRGGGHRQSPRRSDPLASADQPAPPDERAVRRRARPATARGPFRGSLGDPEKRSPHRPFHRRPHQDGSCPRCGHALERARIGGRTTYWCPVCQL